MCKCSSYIFSYIPKAFLKSGRTTMKKKYHDKNQEKKSGERIRMEREEGINQEDPEINTNEVKVAIKELNNRKAVGRRLNSKWTYKIQRTKSHKMDEGDLQHGMEETGGSRRLGNKCNNTHGRTVYRLRQLQSHMSTTSSN